MIPEKSEFERIMIARHTKDVYDKLSAASVAVAGLGGLGSNVSIALARAGVGRLHLVDFDRVDMSNLNRQQYGIRHLGMYKTEALKSIIEEINPYIDVTYDTIRVTAENAKCIFGKFRYICEAFDRPEAKSMLIDSVLSKNNKIVSGSGMAGYLTSNTIITRKITDNFYLCGDGVTDAADVNGLMAPRVMICAAHEANQIIRLILGEEEA